MTRRRRRARRRFRVQYRQRDLVDAGLDLPFASLSLTEVACDSPAMELERAVEAVVGSAEPVAWEIDVRRLDLRTASAGLSLVTE